MLSLKASACTQSKQLVSLTGGPGHVRPRQPAAAVTHRAAHSSLKKHQMRPGAAGFFIPAVGRWPKRACNIIREVVGEDRPGEVSVLLSYDVAIVPMESALRFLSVIDVRPAELMTSRGYPCVHFAVGDLAAHARKLNEKGYTVRVLQERGDKRQFLHEAA